MGNDYYFAAGLGKKLRRGWHVDRPKTPYDETLWRLAKRSHRGYAKPWAYHQNFPATKVATCVCPLCTRYRELQTCQISELV